MPEQEHDQAASEPGPEPEAMSHEPSYAEAVAERNFGLPDEVAAMPDAPLPDELAAEPTPTAPRNAEEPVAVEGRQDTTRGGGDAP